MFIAFIERGWAEDAWDESGQNDDITEKTGRMERPGETREERRVQNG